VINLSRCGSNPIITPDSGHEWEVGGTFNPGAVAREGVIHLLYRAVDRRGTSRLGYARSLDGGEISNRSSTPVLEPSAKWEEFGCEDPRITSLDGHFYVTYTAYSQRGPRIALASTEDFSHFKKHGIVGPDLNDKDCVLFPELIKGKIGLLHRVDGKVQIAYFENLEALEQSRTYWDDYLRDLDAVEVIRPRFHWEKRKVGAGPPPIRTPKGWLVIYHGVSAERIYRVGAVLLDLDDPKKVIARTRDPILQPETEFEKLGVVPNVVFPDGAVVHDGQLLVYYGGADRVCCAASAPLDEFLQELESEKP
jgi:predicted GH43/DUF377 family glycosyl hydrolase